METYSEGLSSSDISSSVANLSLTDSEDRNIYKDVFGNSLIWKKINGYIHLGDLKCLRMVNHFFRDQINRSKLFQEQVVVHLTNDTLKDPDFRSFLATYSKWKNLAVTRPELDLIASYYPNIAETDVSNLKLSWKRGKRTPNTTMETFVIFGLISQTPQLTRLEMDVTLLMQISISGADKNIQDILKNVSDFTVHNYSDLKTPSSRLKQNMKFLASSFVQLKHLTFGNLKENKSITAALLLMAKNNCSTLVSLSISYPNVWEKSDMNEIICPTLKKVNFGNLEGSSLILNSFLRNQPGLKEICISFKGVIHSETLTIIEQKHAKTITKFDIKCTRMHYEDDEYSFDFSKFTGLKDFSLVIVQGPAYDGMFCREDCASILIKLPSTIQKINLRGLRLLSEIELIPSQLPFNNHLTDLSLVFFTKDRAIPNLVKAVITKEDGKLPFPNLKSLELVENFEKFSTKDLSDRKGLRKLRISGEYLTDENVLDLQFPELKHLDISGSGELSSEAIQKMILQNPSLEFLRCSEFGIQKQGRLKTVEIQTSRVRDDPVDSDADAEPVHPVVVDDYSDYDDRYYDDFEDHYYQDSCTFHSYSYDGHCRDCGDYDYDYDSDAARRNS